MEKFNKALKVRIYPTEEQIEQINQTFGCVRFVYNHFLTLNSEHKQSYNQNARCLVELKKLNTFLKNADSTALQQTLKHLDTAFDRFFKKLADKPCYKKKHKKQSYTSISNNNSIRIIDNKHIQMPKLGKVKVNIHRNVPDNWKLMSATVSKTKSNKYYASLLFSYESQVSETSDNNTIGFDYSSSKLYVDNNNQSPDLEKQFRKSERRLAVLQKKLSRMLTANTAYYIKDSKGYNYPVYKRELSKCKNIQKQRVKIAKLSETIANRRADALHKLSKQIADTYNIVCIEDLNMKAIGNKHFGNGKATFDNAWGMFTQMLEYKLKDRGRCLVKIDRFYPSSQLCSDCGCRNKLVKNLNVRSWICPVCSNYHNRDHNAAINILSEGLRIYKDGTARI